MAEVVHQPVEIIKEVIKEVIVYKYFPSKKIAQKKYVDANKEKIKEINKNYYLKNKEKILERQKEYDTKKRLEKKLLNN
jgi:hypothetical protein